MCDGFNEKLIGKVRFTVYLAIENTELINSNWDDSFLLHTEPHSLHSTEQSLTLSNKENNQALCSWYQFKWAHSVPLLLEVKWVYCFWQGTRPFLRLYEPIKELANWPAIINLTFSIKVLGIRHQLLTGELNNTFLKSSINHMHCHQIRKMGL